MRIVWQLQDMVKFEQAFKSAVSDAKRDVLVGQIRSHPEMTISELGKLSVGELGPLLKQITIGDIMAAGAGKSRGRKRAAAPARGGAGKAKSDSRVNTRTQSGRDAYDKAILEILKGQSDPMSAPELKSHVGGTSLQVRTSLNRLISLGHVSYTGKARGTRYQAA